MTQIIEITSIFIGNVLIVLATAFLYFFNTKKIIISNEYYIDAMYLMERLEERTHLLELAEMPFPKIKEDGEEI